MFLKFHNIYLLGTYSTHVLTRPHWHRDGTSGCKLFGNMFGSLLCFERLFLCVCFMSVFESVQCHQNIMTTCAAVFLFLNRSTVCTCLAYGYGRSWTYFARPLVLAAVADSWKFGKRWRSTVTHGSPPRHPTFLLSLLGRYLHTEKRQVLA